MPDPRTLRGAAGRGPDAGLPGRAHRWPRPRPLPRPHEPRNFVKDPGFRVRGTRQRAEETTFAHWATSRPSASAELRSVEEDGEDADGPRRTENAGWRGLRGARKAPARARKQHRGADAPAALASQRDGGTEALHRGAGSLSHVPGPRGRLRAQLRAAGNTPCWREAEWRPGHRPATSRAKALAGREHSGDACGQQGGASTWDPGQEGAGRAEDLQPAGTGTGQGLRPPVEKLHPHAHCSIRSG